MDKNEQYVEDIEQSDEEPVKKTRKPPVFSEEALARKREAIKKARESRKNKIANYKNEVDDLKSKLEEVQVKEEPKVVKPKANLKPKASKPKIVYQEEVEEEEADDDEEEEEEEVVVIRKKKPAAKRQTINTRTLVNESYKEKLKNRLNEERQRQVMNYLFDF
jgi:hypothetical protein